MGIIFTRNTAAVNIISLTYAHVYMYMRTEYLKYEAQESIIILTAVSNDRNEANEVKIKKWKSINQR